MFNTIFGISFKEYSVYKIWITWILNFICL